MSEIIFVRTRHEYDSYVDYWRLVELSGFPTVFTDGVDVDRDALYIVSPINGEWYGDWHKPGERKATLAAWNLERPGGSGGLSNYVNDNTTLVDRGLFDFIFTPHEFLAQRFKVFHFLPLGTHRELGTPSSRTKEYDFIHLMCYSPRRGRLFHNSDRPRSMFGQFSIAPNSWGVRRHEALHKSRFMLSIHQDSYPLYEPLRFALAVAYGLPILAEESHGIYPYDASVTQFVHRDMYAAMAHVSIRRMYSEYQKVAFREYERLTADDMNFRALVEKYAFRA